MPIVVQKYGGSSVADIGKLQLVAQHVIEAKQAGEDVVVVVSAMGNTTNELLGLARAVSPAPGRRELDMLISVGERISMALLSMAINDLGHAAVSFTGSQSGIITDENHAAARIVAVRPWRIQAALDAGKIAIVAGFQGMSTAREVTTLGRGGSDLTAVALTAALQADRCEIRSDVDGIWSADPRKSPTATQIASLSWDEAIHLFRGGAKVLHAEAAAFAHRHGIQVDALANGASNGGTTISPDPTVSSGHVVAVTVDDQLLRVERTTGSIDDLVTHAQAIGAPLRHVDTHAVTVDARDFYGDGDAPWPGGTAPIPVAVATAIGLGAGTPAHFLAGQRALADAAIATRSAACEPDRLQWTMGVEDAARAERLLHDVLILLP
jgi:aspartate kinase